MKKYLKTILACIVIVPCLFLLFGCNDPQTNNLTKQQYATAFGAVETSLAGSDNSGSKTNNLALTPNGYLETNTRDDVSYNLIKFIKFVMQNDTYQLTTDTIQTNITVPDGYGTVTKFRMRLEFDGTNIKGFMGIALPTFEEATTSGGMEQAVLFTINYNFNSNALVYYKIDSYAFMDNLSNSYYESTILEDGKVLRLSNTADEYATISQSIKISYEQEKAKTPVNKDYDFSNEFAQSHQ